MEDYARSMEEIEIRNGGSDNPLTREEMKVLRKYVGKLNWLAAGTRPDLATYTLELGKKQKKAMQVITCGQNFKENTRKRI